MELVQALAVELAVLRELLAFALTVCLFDVPEPGLALYYGFLVAFFI